MEKDELFREGVNYEDAFTNQNGQKRTNGAMQARKLQSSNNKLSDDYIAGGGGMGMGNSTNIGGS